MTDRSVSVPMTLSDPVTRVSRSLYFRNKGNFSRFQKQVEYLKNGAF